MSGRRGVKRRHENDDSADAAAAAAAAAADMDDVKEGQLSVQSSLPRDCIRVAPVIRPGQLRLWSNLPEKVPLVTVPTWDQYVETAVSARAVRRSLLAMATWWDRFVFELETESGSKLFYCLAQQTQSIHNLDVKDYMPELLSSGEDTIKEDADGINIKADTSAIPLKIRRSGLYRLLWPIWKQDRADKLHEAKMEYNKSAPEHATYRHQYRQMEACSVRGMILALRLYTNFDSGPSQGWLLRRHKPTMAVSDEKKLENERKLAYCDHLPCLPDTSAFLRFVVPVHVLGDESLSDSPKLEYLFATIDDIDNIANDRHRPANGLTTTRVQDDTNFQRLQLRIICKNSQKGISFLIWNDYTSRWLDSGNMKVDALRTGETMRCLSFEWQLQSRNAEWNAKKQCFNVPLPSGRCISLEPEEEPSFAKFYQVYHAKPDYLCTVLDQYIWATITQYAVPVPIIPCLEWTNEPSASSSSSSAASSSASSSSSGSDEKVYHIYQSMAHVWRVFSPDNAQLEEEESPMLTIDQMRAILNDDSRELLPDYDVVTEKLAIYRLGLNDETGRAARVAFVNTFGFQVKRGYRDYDPDDDPYHLWWCPNVQPSHVDLRTVNNYPRNGP
jgi:hypothetical protein